MPEEKNHHNNDELLLCFDEQGDVITPQPRSIVHEEPYRIWHAVTNIFILNRNGEILCTRRAGNVSGNAGKWQTYVGGHVKVNSSFIDTAIRELAEEIGIKVSRNELILMNRGRREDMMHVYENHALQFNGNIAKLNFVDGEICEARWMTFDEYQRLKKEDPDSWCNNTTLTNYKEALRQSVA